MSSTRMLFKREVCKVKWQGMVGEFLVIYDMFSKKLHVKGEEKAASFEIDMIEKIEDRVDKIEIYFKSKNNTL